MPKGHVDGGRDNTGFLVDDIAVLVIHDIAIFISFWHLVTKHLVSKSKRALACGGMVKEVTRA